MNSEHTFLYRLARASLVWLLLATHVSAAGIPPDGLLLCFGYDGHFDVEEPHEGRRCHEDSSTASLSKASDDCLDVALLSAELADRFKSRDSVPLPDRVVLRIELPRGPHSRSVSTRTLSSPQAWSNPPYSRRTVVLLT